MPSDQEFERFKSLLREYLRNTSLGQQARDETHLIHLIAFETQMATANITRILREKNIPQGRTLARLLALGPGSAELEALHKKLARRKKPLIPD